MKDRLKKHQRNEEVERLLKELNSVLAVAEQNLAVAYDVPKYPLVFVMGCARSGTTLMMQWLADLGHFAYPSNLMSRFYDAPYVGAKIHKLLLELDDKKEVFASHESISFTSDLGKTKGAASPHEFWYFWRRFFSFEEIQKLSEEALNQVKTSVFLQDLAKIEQVFNRPLAMKAMWMNWHIPFLAKLLPKAIFVFVKRESLYNENSLRQARLNFYGNVETWYSFKPPEYVDLKEQDVDAQLKGQVFYTNQAIEQGLKEISRQNQLTVPYEGFCLNPKHTFEQLRVKMWNLGYNLPKSYEGELAFACQNI